MVLPLDIVTSGLIQNRETRSAAEPDAGDSARLVASFHDTREGGPSYRIGALLAYRTADRLEQPFSRGSGARLRMKWHANPRRSRLEADAALGFFGRSAAAERRVGGCRPRHAAFRIATLRRERRHAERLTLAE